MHTSWGTPHAGTVVLVGAHELGHALARWRRWVCTSWGAGGCARVGARPTLAWWCWWVRTSWGTPHAGMVVLVGVHELGHAPRWQDGASWGACQKGTLSFLRVLGTATTPGVAKEFYLWWNKISRPPAKTKT